MFVRFLPVKGSGFLAPARAVGHGAARGGKWKFRGLNVVDVFKGGAQPEIHDTTPLNGANFI